ncbi:hypothetical protein [Devosia sp. Root413D1]|uniref:hypothetical protein n=1 Tax=unclassified Devosia TaxID=196773 RepID=UPI0012E39A71|nr:hypothetical protein [Devosia sp. Root413D1]
MIFAISGTNGGKLTKPARSTTCCAVLLAPAARRGNPMVKSSRGSSVTHHMIAPFEAVHGKASPMKKSASVEEDRYDFLSRYP